MKNILVFAAMLFASFCSNAQVFSFQSDGTSFFTNPFVINEHIWAEGVGPVDDHLSFVGLPSGTYDVTLYFEAAGLNLTELTLNGTNADISHLSHNFYSFAWLETQTQSPFDVHVFGWFAGEPNTVGNYVGWVTAVQAVPEPSSMMLFAGGILGMGFFVRRQRRV